MSNENDKSSTTGNRKKPAEQKSEVMLSCGTHGVPYPKGGQCPSCVSEALRKRPAGEKNEDVAGA